MSETDTRQHVVAALKCRHALSVENSCGAGTPDVNYMEGWIECKYRRHWPKKPETVVRLDHPWTPQQRLWARKRWQVGGNAYLLLQVSRDWLLFDIPTALRVVEQVPKAELVAAAMVRWTSIDAMKAELRDHVTRNDT